MHEIKADGVFNEVLNAKNEEAQIYLQCFKRLSLGMYPRNTYPTKV